MKKRLLMQIGLVLLIIIVSVFLYRIGKGFQIIVENKNNALDGITFEVQGPVRVIFDDKDKLELKENSADLALLIGYGEHKIKVEVLDAEGNAIKSIEKTFKLSGKEGDFLSIPALLSGSERYIFKRE